MITPQKCTQFKDLGFCLMLNYEQIFFLKKCKYMHLYELKDLVGQKTKRE